MNKFLFLLFILFMNCYASVKPVPIEGCKRIQGTPGPEDMAIDRETGILYISSHERRGELVDGKLFQLNLNSTSEISPVLIETNYPKNFRPHGMSFAKVNGKSLLYVISHIDIEKPIHSLEVFLIEKGKLSHKETILDQSFISPNDLHVISDGRIFISNDRGTGSDFRSYVEAFFGIKRAQISYFDGKKWKLFENAVTFGNGILHKKIGEKEFLYRAATTPEKIYKYEIGLEAGETVLKEVKVFSFDTGPDNLEEDEEGNIYFASHKSMFRFLKHKDDPNYPSPSQVFVIDKKENVKELYANDGTEIPSSSTALTYKNRLYISQVFNPYLLSCPLK
ncbi:MAG: SMP-30/gluconolactonase/LRE family protein [Leptospiraceae bacterium]|nr:SMP-30/gluconolactonase/LRE family protein [Leptospiraceae bacterium]